jgi:PKD repeat protein
MHVGDLDGHGAKVKNTWTANVVVTVHDASHGPVGNATVTGVWSNGASGTSQCSTDAGGQCPVSVGGIRKVTSVDFTVTGVTHGTLTYEAADNHDDEGDASTGTTITVYRDENQPPVASFTWSCNGLTCNFDGSGSSDPDPDGTIERHTWDFGHGSPTTGETISHTYDVEGTYTVVLTVVDNRGASDSDTQQVTVGGSGGGTAHVAGLTGEGVVGERGRWNAVVTVTVHNQDHGPLVGAMVSGKWIDGATGEMSCITNSSGQCSITKSNLKSNVGSATFQVDDVIHTAHSYNPGDNHDPLGTLPTISVPKP